MLCNHLYLPLDPLLIHLTTTSCSSTTTALTGLVLLDHSGSTIRFLVLDLLRRSISCSPQFRQKFLHHQIHHWSSSSFSTRSRWILSCHHLLKKLLKNLNLIHHFLRTLVLAESSSSNYNRITCVL